MEARLCRALAVRGSVSLEAGGDLAAGDLLDGAPWLVLEEGAKVTVKHARTAREVTFEGPGKVRPCYEEEEHFLVTGGVVTTVPGVGARPGAEVLLSTPIGAVRYGDADLRLTAAPEKLLLEVRVGKAWIDGPTPAKGASREVKKGERAQRGSDGVDVKQLVQLCDSGADAYERETREALAGKLPRKGLGERAAANLRARQALRSACGIAAAAVARVDDPQERKTLSVAVELAESRWRRLSRAPKPPNP